MKDAVARALRNLGQDGRLAEGTLVEAPARGEKSILKKWWFWTGVGAVVAAGVATAIVVSQSDGGDTLEITVLP
jgi:hypothetical protein